MDSAFLITQTAPSGTGHLKKGTNVKTLLALTALALLSTGALAAKETCITRILQTNYNSGMEGVASTVCVTTSNDFKGIGGPKCGRGK